MRIITKKNLACLLMALCQSAIANDEVDAVVNFCVAESISESVPGAAVSIVLGNELLYEAGFGNKIANANLPVNAQTLFRTGSTQKMMTAAAVLTQHDQQRLDLSDPITTLVPEATFEQPWSFDSKEITIENLLNHTSGIPNYICDASDLNLGLEEWAAMLSGSHTLTSPGNFFNYSNGGYSLAGLVAERSAGIPYSKVMHDWVWSPSGMHSTFLSPEDALAYGNVSNGHTSILTGEAGSYPVDTYHCGYSEPSGFAFSTVGDMARWTMMLMGGGGQTLSPESAKAIMSPSVDEESRGRFYGYGTSIMEVDNKEGPNTIVWHDGSLPGWTASTIMMPEVQFSINALANGDTGADEIANCILGNIGLLEVEPTEVVLPEPSTWRKFQGVYFLTHTDGEILPALIYFKKDRLFITAIMPNSGDKWILFEAQQLAEGTFNFTHKVTEGDPQMYPAVEISFLNRKSPESDDWGWGLDSQEMWIRSREVAGKRLFSF